jgi:hypothetical protein
MSVIETADRLPQPRPAAEQCNDEGDESGERDGEIALRELSPSCPSESPSPGRALSRSASAGSNR